MPRSTNPPPFEEAVAPGTRVGRYVVLQSVGRGGAGTVYAAYDGELDRKLALKFLHLTGAVEDASASEKKLRREAQTMAKLSHPNVVSVHDVGRWNGNMYLAMDFIGGGTLAQRLVGRGPWRERLDLLCRAGDGIAAAHSAGVVHRDVKPSNVLLDDAGQPRVTDFGIAAAEHSEAPRPSVPDPSGAPPRGPGDDVDTFTEGILGTVGYLAPEQAYRNPVDARCDQFSFCVMLHEALYGEPPFEKADLLTYVDAIGRGPRRPPAGTKVPKAVQAVIARGLSEEPSDRFASMNDLLDALRRAAAPRRPAGFAVAAAIVASVVAIAVTVRSRSDAAPACAAPDASLGGAWTGAERARIGDAFAKASLDGSQSFAPVADAIDAYAGGVAQMRNDACVVAKIRGAQSESVMTRRLECLDERARELGSLVRILVVADGPTLRDAAESLGKLAPIDDCADVAALTAPVPPPTRAIAASVEAARADLAEAKVLRSVGRYSEAAARASAIVDRARAIGYAPLVAEAQIVLGNAQSDDGHDAEGERTLRAAADVADEGKHDLARGQAYVGIATVSGRRLGHYDAAIDASTTALHVAHRIGNARLEAYALEQMGFDHGQTGHVEEGLDESRRALAIRERLDGPDAIENAFTHVALSVALSELARFDEALDEDRAALAIVERHYGPMHPRAGVYHGNLATDLVWAGRADEALPEADRAIAIARAARGTENADYALDLNVKGYALTHLGRFAEASALNEESAAIMERASGADSSNVVYPLVGLGEDWIGLDEPARARPILERAVRIADRAGLDPETMGECHFQLARATWLGAHDAARAIVEARKAADAYARSPRLAPRRREAEELEARIAGGERGMASVTPAR